MFYGGSFVGPVGISKSLAPRSPDLTGGALDW